MKIRANHPDQELLQGFAFGYLDAAEAERVRAHVASCEACLREVEKLERFLGDLSLALPGVDPPSGLEQKVMQRIRDADRSAAPSASPASPPAMPAAKGGLRGARSVSYRSRLLGALAAGVIVVLGAVNVIQWQQAGIARRSTSAPGLSLIVLVGRDADVGAYGTVVLDAQDNGGVLAVRGLRPLDPSLTYQLWLYRDSEQRSAGIFGVSPDGYGNLLLDVPEDFKGFTSIGITVEPAGGSATPTGPVVAKGAP